MDYFDEKFWNLAQASAWVIYREKGLVDQLEQSTREEFMSLGMYTSMEPASRQKVGSIRELSLALSDECLQAWGYRANGDSYLKAIPSLEWPDLDLAPPFAYHAKNRAQQYQPWTDIRVESAAVKKLWRSILEKDGRSKYSKAKIEQICNDLRYQNPDISQNELISEIQIEYAAKHDGKEPCRSSIQRYIKSFS
jgi:hypothetical protein